MNSIARSLFMQAALIISLACNSSSARAADAAFELYAAFALTGSASSYGEVELNGATLALEKFNQTGELDGKKVKLVVEDTQSSNAQTLNAIRKLISFNHADIILGPTWLDSYQAVLPVTDKEKILLFSPSAAAVVFKKNAEDYPLAFSTWFNLEVEVQLLLKHMQQLNSKRIILTFDQDPYFQTVRSIIHKKASALGLEIVSDDSVDLQATDFRSLLAKYKGMKSDGVIIGFGDESSLMSFLKQRGEILPTLKLYGNEMIDGYASQQKLVHLFNNVDFVSPQVHDRGSPQPTKRALIRPLC